jgi:hypothetical protein
MKAMKSYVLMDKKIENVYEELENHFNSLFEQISFENQELEFNDEKKELMYIKEERIFEKYLEIQINQIESHLLYQFDSYFEHQIKIYQKNQNIFQENYSPEKRFNKMMEAFMFMISMPDFKEVILTKYQKEIFNIGFNAYVSSYKLLTHKLNDIFTNILPNTKLPHAPKIFNFKDLFLSEKKFIICKDCMEDIGLTFEEKVLTSRGRAGKAIGLMVAIREYTAILLKLEKITEKDLFDSLNKFLGTSYTTINKRSIDYKESYDLAKKFFSNKFKSNK